MNQKAKNYYEANLTLLKKHHPSVFLQITQDPPDPFGEISFAPNGNPTLSVTDNQGETLSLHDTENPEKETENFLGKIPAEEKGFVAILGMGLCYSALRIFQERPHLQYLALFELEPGIFIQALKYMDLSPILPDPRLILVIGVDTPIPEALAAASRTLQLEDARLLHHLSSFTFNPDGYNQLKDDLYAHINGLNVGGVTTRMLGRDFVNNRFQHITTIHHHQLVEHLENRFAGVPAILVAGGPSLDKNIHLLKRAQENAVIIAVDTVLPALLKNGVHPHFLTCIDPNDLTFEKFADVIPMARDIALICSSWVNPKTPKIFPADQVFWTFTGKPMEAWLNSLLGGKLLTGGASTVAHLNLVAAHMLHCDPIIFIGQDLAYPGPDSASHANGSVLQGSAPKNRLTGHVEGETVVGINGEILRTNRSFLSMKKFFESAIAKSDKTHINATEGGANIEGTQILTLQEVLEKYCTTRIDPTRRLKKFYTEISPIDPGKMLGEFNTLLAKARKLNTTIKKSDDITKSLFKDLTKIQKSKRHVKSFDMLSVPQKQKINKIDKFHKTLDNTLEVWKILEEITMEGLKQSERQKQDISILQNDSAKYLEWLTKNLTRLLDINKIRKSSLALLSDNLNMVSDFYKKETACLKKITADPQNKKNKLDLARLYVETKNYRLARRLLNELVTTMPESGDVHFFLGCVAAHSANIEQADQYFQKAIECDPAFDRQIAACKHELGHEFLTFARYFKTQLGREPSVKYMVIKGMKYHPENSDLKKELEIILKQDLEKIKSDIAADHHPESEQLINQWYKTAMDQKTVFDSIAPDITGRIFLYQAKLFLSRKDNQNAIATLEKAMYYAPNNPDIHSMTIDTLFMTGYFNRAIEALNKAIKVDTQFAAYWETIGDSLQHAGQHTDAITAYENCFTLLPENISLLKKIGDSYMATDQLEAAKSAYEQLTLKLETTGKG